MINIRPAQIADLDAITEIYNEAIQTTTATFDTEPKTRDEQLAWLEAHGPKYPILVADLDGRVVGWACLSRWSGRCAYSETAETTFYVTEEHRRKGIGRKLKTSIVEEGRRLGFHTLIARVAEGSQSSLHMNESFGFKYVGVMKEVGRKFGKLLDVHILQKIFESDTEHTSANSEQPQGPASPDQLR